MNKKVKIAIEIGLLGVIVLLSFLVYNSVNTNIEFENEKARKQELVVEKLIKIRDLQNVYESKHDTYSNSWESLIEFALKDSLVFDYKEGDMEDSAAVAEGRAFIKKVKRPAIEKLIADGIIADEKELKELRYVPETDQEFTIKSGSVMAGGIKMPTFEVGVTWDVLLKGLDKQLIINAKENSRVRSGFEGVRVGKIDEASTEGNWE
ncbi:MAG TPA: hypothetical protein PK734_01585 [Bacteroidales bacterium]|nr:MAG: hypothetical protein BWY22_00226 [Bacteroidetes bacterium ADurb.Bin217]HOS85380.1 hypothetical protein [Bacteroidales bacterium]HPM12161.1 hypothetical protein [Bacteroidales bacterium]